jgi:hypothetical protein
MTVADLVDEIFRLYRPNKALFFGVSATIWLPASIALFVFQLGYFGGRPAFDTPIRPLSPQDLSDSVIAAFGALAIAFIIGVVAGPLLLGGVTAAVSARYLAQPIAITPAVRRAFGCYLRITASYAVVAIVALLALIGTGIAGAFIAARVGGAVGAILAVVTVVVAVVAVVWIATTWSLAGQAVVIEDVGVRGALRRSQTLVAGSRWRVIGINLLLGLIQAVLFTIPSTVVAVVTAPLPSPLGPAVSEVVTSLAQIAYFPIQLGTLTLLYYDLRVRKEAFDLSLAADQLARA